MKRTAGRPITVKVTKKIGARLDDATFEALWRLRAKWKCSAGEVIRRAIIELDDRNSP